MAIAAAIFWGISGTCAQFLFEHKAFDPAWLVCWRLILGGLVLVILWWIVVMVMMIGMP